MRRFRAEALGALVFVAMAVVIVVPLLTVLVWAFADRWFAPALWPQALGVHWWGMLLARADVTAALPLSLMLALGVTALSALVCLPAAYAFARLEFPGRRWLLLSFIALNAFPRFPLYVSIAVVFLSAGLVGTVAGVVLIQLVFSLFFMIWIPVAAFHGVDRRLEEAARDVGASHLVVLLRITLPQVAPALGAAMLLTFVNTFYEVEGALLIGVPHVVTLPIVMLSLINGQVIVQYGAVLSVLLWVPSLLLIAFAGRLFASRSVAAGLGA